MRRAKESFPTLARVIIFEGTGELTPRAVFTKRFSLLPPPSVSRRYKIFTEARGNARL